VVGRKIGLERVKEVLCRMQLGNKRLTFLVTQWFLLQNNAKTRTAQVVMSSLTDISGKPV